MPRYHQDIYKPVNPDKYAGSGEPIYRSALELQLFRFLDMHPSVINWASEPIQIPYYNQLKRKQTVYVPDLLVVYLNKNNEKKVELIEVKPKSQVTMKEARSKTDKYAVALNHMKWEAAAAYCKNKNMTFRIMTEEDIYLNSRGNKNERKTK